MSKVEPLEEAPQFPSFDEEADERNGLIYSTFSSSVSFLRPFAPQIVPLLVCTFFIPIILAISGFAGFVVWNSLSPKWQVPIYLQYGNGVAPNAQFVVSPLHTQQHYDISLHLVVPTSDSNLALGNFMAALTLSSVNNKTLTAVRRSAVVVSPRAWWIIGTPKVIDIYIPMLTSFVAGASSLLADVSLGRSDNWKILGSGEARELSVVSASLDGLAVPHGIRGLAIRFPLLSSVFAAFIFLSISTLILGMCILPIMLPSGLEGDDTPKTATASSVPFSPSDRPRRRKKSHFKRPSEQTSPSSSIAKEEEFTSIPPAEEAMPERIRQRKISVKLEPEVES